MTPDVSLIVIAAGSGTASDLAVLNPEEIARADRFTVDHPRRVFITARAALRKAVADRLQKEPTELDFTVGAHGKPRLEPASSLRFNLSHSGNTIVIAITDGIDLGVDVEELGRDTPTRRLSRRFFTDSEARAVEQASETDRNRVFFHCWTTKEAVLKATGSGLTVPVREVEVDPNPDAPPRLISLGGDRNEAAHWTLLRHETPDRWISTVALRGPRRTLTVIDPASHGSS